MNYLKKSYEETIEIENIREFIGDVEEVVLIEIRKNGKVMYHESQGG